MYEFIKEAKEIWEKYPEIIEEYYENIATNENFDMILEKIKELFKNEEITLNNLQPNPECRKYQYIEVRFKEFELTFSFLDLDGLDAKYDMELYNKGKKYNISPYFLDTFQSAEDIINAADNIKIMMKEINKILQIK